MSEYISSKTMDTILSQLSEAYHIYAPKRFANRGWKPKTDLIRYGEIKSVDEVVFDEKSNLSPKEVFYPINQTMLYFTKDNCFESQLSSEKGILLFLKPCDINAIERLDTIFLKNGSSKDHYYNRLREKLTIVMMECVEGSDSCFCVSMGTNKVDHYDLAVRKKDGKYLLDVKSEALKPYFESVETAGFVPEFVTSNERSADVPEIKDKAVLKAVHDKEFWARYDDECISCGGCNTVCGSCSCFDTTDIIYHETSRDGERRRIWSSCMLEDYSTMAGGHNVRSTPGERMRFKTMHKIHDFKERFGTSGQMCVGCGRCIDRCPQDIDFLETINRLSQHVKSIEQEQASGGSHCE